ncbi:MAG: ABC transporter ATP-binding protein/permease [Prochlorococcus marinus XMU1429]|nr:ABC transporter ATP-binding protein [Prochlorococcus marinus]MCQ9198949.1 ABC transporter ATP-binding protein/permease [Prochlorococcus marinus XMU1429]
MGITNHDYLFNLSIRKTFLLLWNFISKKNKISLIYLTILNIIAGFSEFISLSLLIPFIHILDFSEDNLNDSFIKNISDLLGIDSLRKLQIIISLIFIMGIIFSGIIRTLAAYYNTRISANIGSQLGADVVRSILSQPFSFFKINNSSESISTSTIYVKETMLAIKSVLNIITAFIIVIFIFFTLLKSSGLIAITFFIFLIFLYFIIFVYANKMLKANSKQITAFTDLIIKKIQESYSSIRNIIMYSERDVNVKIFYKYNDKLRNKEADNSFIAEFPRFSIETLALSLLAFISLIASMTSQTGNLDLSIIGIIALGAQKLLPLFQSSFTRFSYIKGRTSSINKVLYYLTIIKPYEEKDNYSCIQFNNLSIKSVKFFYSDKKNMVFNGIDISINSGDRIGLVGKTGSGKSTLIDLIIGLTKPTDGQILVNDKNIHLDESLRESWMKSIAIVPQDFFLLNDTLISNIAVNVPKEKIDLNHISSCIETAELSSFVDGQVNGLNTLITENGKNLSGGQKQRIGIARALYRKCKFLILDEATSALDSKTENKIINKIKEFDDQITIFIVAHRESTLAICNRVYEVKNGNLDLYHIV